MRISVPARRATAALAACLIAAALPACAPLVVGAAVGTGVLVASDRRTSGAQIEDSAIEVKMESRVREAFGTRVRVNASSYNRQLLLTGEVANADERQRVQQLAEGLENVRSVVNELAVSNSPSLTQRTADRLITGRAKAAIVDTRELSVHAFKITTERGIVYLMGRVTRREAETASEVVRKLDGVAGVVRIFDYIGDEELRRMQSPPAN